MKKFNIQAKVCRKKCIIDARTALQRLNLAKILIRKPFRYFKRILRCDEANICLYGKNMNKFYVNRLQNEGLLPDFVKSCKKFRGGGDEVSFWICSNYEGAILLSFYDADKLDSNQYINILDENLNEAAEMFRSSIVAYSDFILLHDRDPSHSSAKTQNWLLNRSYKQILIPGNSPDLNLAGNIIHRLKKKVFADRVFYRNLEEVKSAIIQTWYKMGEDDSFFFRNLILTFKNRQHQVIKNNGYYTKYKWKIIKLI